MGIDLATWRARIGQNYCRRGRYACRPLPVQWRAVRWGVGEVVNSTPLVLQGCMAFVCGVCLLLGVCLVVLSLLLMAGDVERNPGPTGKEGSDEVDKMLPGVDDSPLGEDDFFDLLKDLMPAVAGWKAIGEGLRLSLGTLDEIETAHNRNPRDCMSAMLKHWLRRNYNTERFGEPTWRAVVKVVGDSAAGSNCALATSIAGRHSVVTGAASQTSTRSQDSCASSTVPDEGASVSPRPTSTQKIAAATPQPPKQTPTRSQEDSCASSTVSDDVFTSEGASVSPRPSSSTQSEGSQKPPFGCGCGKCTFYSYIESGCPNPIPSASSFPCLDFSRLTHEQQQELRGRLRVESKAIMIKFQHLFSTVYESLCARSIPVDKLVTHLLSLGAFDPVYEGSQKPVFQIFFKELQDAGSIEKVLWVIRDYFSFFNYHVIEHIVSELGTDQDKAELQHYKKEFDLYSKRRIYECLPVFGPVSEVKHADLVLKVDSVYEKFTVEELEDFQHRLGGILRVSSQGLLRLCRVEKGCFQLVFQVPSFVQQEIFPLSSEQERALVAENVIKLTCGNYEFVAKGEEDEFEPEDTERHHVDLVRCPEYPEREGEYVIQVCAGSFRVWTTDLMPKARVMWEWPLKQLRRIHWHRNVNKLEVEAGRAAETGEGHFFFTGQHASKLFEAMKVMMTSRAQQMSLGASSGSCPRTPPAASPQIPRDPIVPDVQNHPYMKINIDTLDRESEYMTMRIRPNHKTADDSEIQQNQSESGEDWTWTGASSDSGISGAGLRRFNPVPPVPYQPSSSRPVAKQSKFLSFHGP